MYRVPISSGEVCLSQSSKSSLVPFPAPGEKLDHALMVPAPLSCPRVSWTTSCRTRTASSSSPHCMEAEGPSLLRHPCRGRTEQTNIPLGPASRSPCPPWLPSSLPYPPSSLQAGKRGQVLKMSLSQAREQGKAGRQAPEPSAPSQQLRWGRVPLWCVRRRRGLCGQVTQLPSIPVSV